MHFLSDYPSSTVVVCKDIEISIISLSKINGSALFIVMINGD